MVKIFIKLQQANKCRTLVHPSTKRNITNAKATLYPVQSSQKYIHVMKLGLDFGPKNWEFRVFAKQAMSKKLGISRFRQTGPVQKIGIFTETRYTYESQF